MGIGGRARRVGSGVDAGGVRAGGREWRTWWVVAGGRR